MEWQPIKTAPKDGTAILVSGTDGQMAVAEFKTHSDGSSGWEIGHSEVHELWLAAPVTHWMPLPNPPPSASTSPAPQQDGDEHG